MIAFMAMAAFGTTWAPVKVADPLGRGKCRVHEPMSYGSYIYQWPSKYDQVFWPYTDGHALWVCERSGYAAFMPEFEPLEPEEATRMRAFLETAPPVSDDSPSLQLLERVRALAELRNPDPVRRNHLRRVMGYLLEDRDPDASRAFRKAAYEEIEQELTGKLEPHRSLEYRYVAANYARELGDTAASDRHLVALRGAIAEATGETAAFASYLKDLLADTERIAPGGSVPRKATPSTRSRLHHRFQRAPTPRRRPFQRRAAKTRSDRRTLGPVVD